MKSASVAPSFNSRLVNLSAFAVDCSHVLYCGQLWWCGGEVDVGVLGMDVQVPVYLVVVR